MALPKAERALMLAIFGDGQSVKKVAELQQRDLRLLRLQVRKLATRVLSETFAFVIRNQAGWSADLRAVAEAVVIRGVSVRQAARELGVTYHIVRRHRDAINAMVLSSKDRTRRNEEARADPLNRRVDLQGAA